ncbi:hypothetical protein [Heliobacterium chlorum]|uniref:hypothetical protein n=1 Tax=Heliobacterium chlorum TaxID=2698 RepID=UPI003C6BF4C9
MEDAGYSVIIEAWDFNAGKNFITMMDEALKTSRHHCGSITRFSDLTLHES